MTDLEILKSSIDTLGSINVPLVLMESIGVPVYQVRANLKALYDAVMKNASKQQEEKPIEPPKVEDDPPIDQAEFIQDEPTDETSTN